MQIWFAYTLSLFLCQESHLCWASFKCSTYHACNQSIGATVSTVVVVWFVATQIIMHVCVVSFTRKRTSPYHHFLTIRPWARYWRSEYPTPCYPKLVTLLACPVNLWTRKENQGDGCHLADAGAKRWLYEANHTIRQTLDAQQKWHPWNSCYWTSRSQTMKKVWWIHAHRANPSSIGCLLKHNSNQKR